MTLLSSQHNINYKNATPPPLSLSLSLSLILRYQNILFLCLIIQTATSPKFLQLTMEHPTAQSRNAIHHSGVVFTEVVVTRVVEAVCCVECCVVVLTTGEHPIGLGKSTS